MSDVVLQGGHVRLEPLSLEHVEGLVRASASGAELYRWSPVPQSLEAARKYVETAVRWRAEGTAVPFAVVRLGDGVVIGSTRFFDVERWAWPEGHERFSPQRASSLGTPGFGRMNPDVCEIGYTWYSPEAIRTAANTEAKLLMLSHAFEVWGVLRVCLHTDVRNDRSRRAIERIGGKFEGVLRSHRMAADFTARDSARYSILAVEWPEVKGQLVGMMHRS